jgi:hypothetical protein
MPTIALLLLVLALPAAAQKPTITETPFTGTFNITGGPANGACNFDVLLAAEPGRPNKERTIQFANTTIIAGPLFVTLTGNGKTENVNISGPSVISFTGGLPTEQVLLGPAFLFNFPPSVTTAAGLPAVSLINGRTIITFDAQGNPTTITFAGTVRDVCQMLE